MKGATGHVVWLLIDNGEVIRESHDYGVIVAAFRGRGSPTARVIRGRSVRIGMQPDGQWRRC